MTENKVPIKTARYLRSIKTAMFLRGINTYDLIIQGRCIGCSSNITFDQFKTKLEMKIFRKTNLCVKCQDIEGGR